MLSDRGAGAAAQIYERAGYRAFREEQGARGAAWAAAVEGLSYQLAPRADLFRRDEGAAQDLAALRALMRSNHWRNDTSVRCTPAPRTCPVPPMCTSRPPCAGSPPFPSPGGWGRERIWVIFILYSVFR